MTDPLLSGASNGGRRARRARRPELRRSALTDRRNPSPTLRIGRGDLGGLFYVLSSKKKLKIKFFYYSFIITATHGYYFVNRFAISLDAALDTTTTTTSLLFHCICIFFNFIVASCIRFYKFQIQCSFDLPATKPLRAELMHETTSCCNRAYKKYPARSQC